MSQLNLDILDLSVFKSQLKAMNYESVNAYYLRFHRMLARQKKHIKDSEDKHIYNFIFVTRLKKNINAEVFCFFESLHIEDMKFNEVYKLTKCEK